MTTYEPADWEPGDIAWIEADGTEPQHRLLYVTMAGNYRWHGADGFVSDVTSARRLQVVDPASVVVLDPNNPDDVQRLSVALAKYDDDESAYSVTADNVLRSLLPTPPPPEPNGLGAVVVDVDDEWVRTSRDTKGAIPWLSTIDGEERNWGELKGPDVLSHGVGCSCGAPDCNGGDQ